MHPALRTRDPELKNELRLLPIESLTACKPQNEGGGYSLEDTNNTSIQIQRLGRERILHNRT